MMCLDHLNTIPSMRRRGNSKTILPDESVCCKSHYFELKTRMDITFDTLQITADVPDSLKPDTVHVEVDGKYLIITGLISTQDEHKETDIIRRKQEGCFYEHCDSQTFTKKIVLPPTVDVNQTDAGVSKNGVLIINIPFKL
ncbi:heat-shock protein Hsp20 [Acrasis kona]|uniref:Heat-shock protein Hsp20 n=1 Tax=Acrasis kona TaxID=1008807 RepID=A0AAW2ZIZ3_9EUKA